MAILGFYLSRSQFNLANAIKLALINNPNASRLQFPMGNWVLDRPITASDGLRNNLCFDGLSKDACKIKVVGNGHMFLMSSGSQSNMSWKNLTFEFDKSTLNYNSSINLSNPNNCEIDNCRFVSSFPDATNNGVYHFVLLAGGKNNKVTNCHFIRTQLLMCSLGRSVDGAVVKDNLFEDCNDYGVSAISGNTSGLSIKNIRIESNEFKGLMGAGYIYVGSDANGAEPDVEQVLVKDNIMSGAYINQLQNQIKIPVMVALGRRNKRIQVSGNIISNSNPDLIPSPTYGIIAFSRSEQSEETEDLFISDNQIDFRSTDTLTGIEVLSPNINGVIVKDNIIRSGSRGIKVDSASNVDIVGNKVYGSISNGIEIGTNYNSVSDIKLKDNFLQTSVSFKPSILFSGPNSHSRIVSDGDRLESPGFAAIKTSVGSLEFRIRNNSANAPLHSSVVPVE